MAANTSFKPVKVKPTLINGDCFFSGIYRAAEEQGILDIFRDCLEIPIDEGEKPFILSLRNRVSHDGLLAADHTYELLRQLYEDKNTNPNSRQTLNSTMSDRHIFDKWHKKIIRETILTATPDKDAFVLQIIEGIQETGNYIGQIEFDITREILESCNIILETKNTKVQKLQKKRSVDGEIKDVITVYNCNHGHFEYFSFPFTVAKTRKPNNEKKKAANGNSNNENPFAASNKSLRNFTGRGGRRTHKR